MEEKIEQFQNIINQALDFIGDNPYLDESELDSLVEILDSYREV